MSNVLVNGTKLFYEEDGEGEPLILLHGLTSSHLMYKEEMEFFKKYFRVIALDSRGHGKSEKPAQYTLQDHVEDVISLMDYLEIEEANILGMSMGSYIAQGVAIKVPERVKKLILGVSKAYGKTSSLERLFNKYKDEIEGMDYMESMAYLSKYIFYDTKAAQQSSIALEKEEVPLKPAEEEAARKALEDFDFRSNLKKIEAKTLVISGTYDGLNPPEYGKEVAKLIPNATYIEFEHSGHGPNIEEPDKFRKEVLAFLRK
jgi:3-oxoadipate enol-lactonase